MGTYKRNPLSSCSDRLHSSNWGRGEIVITMACNGLHAWKKGTNLAALSHDIMIRFSIVRR